MNEQEKLNSHSFEYTESNIGLSHTTVVYYKCNICNYCVYTYIYGKIKEVFFTETPEYYYVRQFSEMYKFQEIYFCDEFMIKNIIE